MTPIKKLQRRLKENVDCLLVTNEKNQRYLSGLNYTDGYVVVGREKAFLLADFRYIEVAKRHESDELTVIMLEKNALNNVFKDNGYKNVGFEDGSMTVSSLEGLKKAFPDAPLLCHPECPKSIRDIADCVCSTEKMISFCRENPSDKFIVATIMEMIHRLRKDVPNKSFISATVSGQAGLHCKNMQLNTPEKLLACLENLEPKIELSAETIEKAKKPIEKMLTMSL